MPKELLVIGMLTARNILEIKNGASYIRLLKLLPSLKHTDHVREHNTTLYCYGAATTRR